MIPRQLSFCKQYNKHLGSVEGRVDDMMEDFRSVYSYFVFAYPIIKGIVELP